MKNSTVSLKRILLENFKNVKKGEIPLVRKVESGACVAGIYGQNGSGKTAIIEAMSLLKHCLLGYPMDPTITNYFASCINVDSESARLEFEFAIEDVEAETNYKVVYCFTLKKEDSNSNTKLIIRNERFPILARTKTQQQSL